ncbi:MAG TPA: hypothetical protein VNB64_08685, partial [Solirubrobacteraceae bacterium]|nr:hypothetical protein [Solirubrobacteraceae bacterium]
MKRSKLFMSLIVAGGLTVGLGSSLGPATAQQRIITAVLITGQSVSVTVPAGTPCSADALGPLAAPVSSVSCTDVPAPAQPAQPAQPSTPTQTSPTTSTPPPGPGTTTPQAPTSTTPKPRPKSRTRRGATRVEDLGAQREERRARARRPDGAPTVDNPSFTLATPGAAPIGVPNFFIEKFRIPP